VENEKSRSKAVARTKDPCEAVGIQLVAVPQCSAGRY
jgi:hypothetical protein